jgi:transcriptional regulator of acetoin/glycerol metabolism
VCESLELTDIVDIWGLITKEALVTAGKELDRNAARRLAIIKHAQKVTGNVAMTCRYYGISRQVFYTWLRRYQAEHTSHLDDETSHFDDVGPRRQPE